jgi:hypothetical protein
MAVWSVCLKVLILGGCKNSAGLHAIRNEKVRYNQGQLQYAYIYAGLTIIDSKKDIMLT